MDSTPSQRSGLDVDRDTARGSYLMIIDALGVTLCTFNSVRQTARAAPFAFDVFTKSK